MPVRVPDSYWKCPTCKKVTLITEPCIGCKKDLTHYLSIYDDLSQLLVSDPATNDQDAIPQAPAQRNYTTTRTAFEATSGAK